MSGVKGTSRTGDITELEVALHLLNEGYEVFKNVGCTGLVDLVVICPKTKEILLYDVKTTTTYTDRDNITTIYSNAATEEQRKLGVEVVTLHKEKLYTDPIKIKERFKNENT